MRLVALIFLLLTMTICGYSRQQLDNTFTARENGVKVIEWDIVSGVDVPGSEKFERQKLKCPEDQPEAREILELFLTHSDFSNDSNEAGVDDFSTSQIRVLTDSTRSVIFILYLNLLFKIQITNTSLPVLHF